VIAIAIVSNHEHKKIRDLMVRYKFSQHKECFENSLPTTLKLRRTGTMIELIKYRRFLFFLFLASLLIRLLFFKVFLQNNPVQLAFDSGQYHSVATSLVHGKGFSNPDGFPAFYRLPGYPLFLSIGYSLFDNSVTATLLMQIVLASIIPLLVFILSLLCFPLLPFVAYGSSIITMLHPGFIIFSGMVMSETLFAVLFLLFFILFLLALQPRRLWFMFASGAFLGAASLVRPVGIFALGLAAIACMLLASGTIRNKILNTGMLVCGWLMIAGLWLVRNYALTGMIFFHTLSGPHFLNHGAVRVVMMDTHCSYEQARTSVYALLEQKNKQRAQHLGHSLTDIEQSRSAEQLSASILMQHPWITMKLCVLNIFKTMFSLYSSELLFIDSGGYLPPYDVNRGLSDMVMRFVYPSVNNRWVTVVIYWELLLYVFIIIGMLGLIFLIACQYITRKKIYGIMLLFIMLFLALSCICGFARLRLPIEPFFIMLSMEFWNYILTRKRVE
jgi:4-amino-4-deoxy-L-arabinose transferase-like glycosyltransferase